MQFNRIINYLFSVRLVTVGGNGIVLVLLSVAVIAFLNALQCPRGVFLHPVLLDCIMTMMKNVAFR